MTRATDLSNSSCSNPDGQIALTIAGGSKVLTGGGLFTYEWETTNGLPGFPIIGTTDGNSMLDLATLAGLPGLPGGDYTLELYDILQIALNLRTGQLQILNRLCMPSQMGPRKLFVRDQTR